jgi:ElaB/YqjD/DUF883 family membrane-anchored ribosome-binding protein
MSSYGSDSGRDVLLTTNDLQKLVDDCNRMTSEIAEIDAKRAEIEARRSNLMERYEQVRSLLDLLGIQHNVPPLTGKTPAPPPEAEAAERSPWIAQIKRVIGANDGRISYPDLKAAILASDLGDQFRASEKGYYHSIARLLKRNELIKHSNWLFTPDSYELLKEQKESIFDFSASRASPIADAILSFVKEAPSWGVPPAAIVEMLLGKDEFRATVQKNNSSAYNVIARLVRRNQIFKRDGNYFPVHKNEAPNAIASEPQRIPLPGGSDRH